jgi:uncharacterized SAM-binding protein YcdF (DUF218 family)
MKRLAVALAIAAAVAVAGFALLLLAVVVDMLLPESAAASDCIIVPGCKVTGTTPSLSLQSRLDCALRLYRAGYADTIIVCGGLGESASVTEAWAMRAYLVARGVPEAAILLDEHSSSTAQNMQNSKALMDAHGLESAIVATSDFHAARAAAIAKSAGIRRVTAGKARFSWPAKWIFVVREVPGWGKYLLNAMGLLEG